MSNQPFLGASQTPAKNKRIQEESFAEGSETSSFGDKSSFLVKKDTGDSGKSALEKQIEKQKLKKQKKAADDDDDSEEGTVEEIEEEFEKNMRSSGRSTSKSIADYDIKVELRDNEAPSLILYKYRWVVLFAYFLTSTATGAVQGSLSENRMIIDKIEPSLDKSDLDWAKYSDLVMYFPMNFASIWLIENHGLRKCVTVGSVIMIIGSVMRFISTFSSIWWWFFGHVVCMSSQAYLKNPVTKLASNWFGDKERGMATAIGIVSGPLGIFISKILIIGIFEDKDKWMPDSGGSTIQQSKDHFTLFIFIHSILSVALVLPALFLIREKPPSPPSMVATKPRPVQTFREAFAGLRSNTNYIFVFMYFNCVNSVSIYNAEIEPFTNQYVFSLAEQTWASMLNCVAGIAGSIILGNYLDKYKCFKNLQIMLAAVIPITILITFLLLHFDAPNLVVVGVAIIAGAPLSSVSVVSYQFAAEVIYPVSEVQGVSMMNVVNKLVTLAVVKLTTALVDDTPAHINYMYGFILWISLPLIGLIPAFLVEEDLRRLNMKDVKKSEYVEESALLGKTDAQRAEFYKTHNVIANQDVLELFFVIEDKHCSVRDTYQRERMTTDEEDQRLSRKGRKSHELRSSSSYKKHVTGGGNRLLDRSQTGGDSSAYNY